MKNFLIISLLILSVGFSQQKKTDKPNPMKGVKTQTELLYYYEEKFGESKENLFTKSVNKYDSDGNMVESLRYGYYNSSDFYESIFSYLPKFIDDYYNLNYKWIYKYDSNGNMVEELYNKTDGQSSPKVIFINKYDTKNRIIEVISYPKRFDEFKRPTKKTIYEYEEY